MPASEVREWIAYFEILRDEAVNQKLRQDGERMREKYRDAE
jgi:hypothetical protein